MTQITFYPIGNADCCLMKTGSGNLFIFDFAEMHIGGDEEDRRMPLAPNLKQDIGWPKRKEVDVLTITHGDNDHIKGIPDTFWLHHAAKYQGEERIKFKELWVPAALLCDGDAEDACKIIRAEARHRFFAKEGIRVFARPEQFKEWLEGQGKRTEDYSHLFVDAGRLVPGWKKEVQGVEFFVHSPYAERTADGLLERNENCIVMQARIREEETDTNFLITADSSADNWVKMVTITKEHKNEQRLAWDILKIPHHGSYLSMAYEKGDKITEPTPEFAWMLEQGAEKCVMVCSSREVLIDDDPEDKLPPHLQTYKRYQQTEYEKDGELIVTMENPNKKAPKRTVIEVNGQGATLKKAAITAATVITSSRSPRMG